MKAYKIYGGDICYINGEQVNAYNFPANEGVAQYKEGYSDAFLFVFETEADKSLVNAHSLEVFESVEVSYSTFKCLEKSSGAGRLIKGEYNAEKKTIIVSATA